MTQAKVVHMFDVSADQLWELIGDFGDVGKWSTSGSCVSEGDGVGALRTLTLDDGRIIVDRLEDFGNWHYSYSIVESPLPFHRYLAKMEVMFTSAEKCKLIWSSDFQPKGMNDEKAIEYIEGVYHWGIGMMIEALKREKTRNS